MKNRIAYGLTYLAAGIITMWCGSLVTTAALNLLVKGEKES